MKKIDTSKIKTCLSACLLSASLATVPFVQAGNHGNGHHKDMKGEHGKHDEMMQGDHGKHHEMTEKEYKEHHEMMKERHHGKYEDMTEEEYKKHHDSMSKEHGNGHHDMMKDDHHGSHQGMMKQGHRMVDGTGRINKVMGKNAMVNISHEPMPELGWPKMRMNFKAADGVNLENLKPGQVVNFTLEVDDDNNYKIQKIDVVK